MQSVPKKFAISITVSDLEKIRSSLRRWGKPEEVVCKFSGSQLHTYYEMWSQFVDTDWSNWDISEYDHDIGCRYWIQIAIENSNLDTRKNLEKFVSLLDEQFKARMKPSQIAQPTSKEPFLGSPYFWETHTIHPVLMLDNQG